MYADLHIHTTYSDGLDSPDKILHLALSHGITTIAITDHDTVEGVKEARALCGSYNLKLIDGVEITTNFNNTDVHILGYHINIFSSSLKTFLEESNAKKTQHTQINFINAVKNGEIDYDWQRVVELNPHHEAITGINVIYALNKDCCNANGFKNNWDFYRQYFQQGGKKYIPPDQKSPYEAIRIIKLAGGIPVIAHPKYVGGNKNILELVRGGAMGIEAYHSTHSEEENEIYLSIARENELLITGGSGWFGSGNPRTNSEFGSYGLKHGAYGILRFQKPQKEVNNLV